MSKDKEQLQYWIHNQRFGLELEFYGMTRADAAKLVAEYFMDSDDDTAAHINHNREHGLDSYSFLDDKRRTWKIVSDSSINTHGTVGCQCELVTPPLNYDDIPALQNVVRLLRSNGAKTDSSCGIHVHIDGANHTPQSIRNLAFIVSSKDRVMLNALNVPQARRENWCQPVEKQFVEELAKIPKDVLSHDKIEKAYYGCYGDYVSYDYSRRSEHYNSHRYYLLNLHDFYNGHKTVEFRAFNSSMHAGKVKSYVQFCLAISAQSIVQKSARYKPFDLSQENHAFTFRTWLLNMGLIGDEFKTCRDFILKQLDGDRSNKYDEETRAQRRKERASKKVAKTNAELINNIQSDLDRIRLLPAEEQAAALRQLFNPEGQQANNSADNNNRGRGR